MFNNPLNSSRTHPPKPIKINWVKYVSVPFKSFVYSPTSIIYHAYSCLVRTFMNTYMIIKPCLLSHLLYDFHIKPIQNPPSQIQKNARSLFPNFHCTHSYYSTYSTHNTLHSWFYPTHVYTPSHQNSLKFKNFVRQAYIHYTMTGWGKLKHEIFPASVWGKSGWDKCDTINILDLWGTVKIPGRPTFLKRKKPPSLELSTRPTKKPCS